MRSLKKIPEKPEIKKVVKKKKSFKSIIKKVINVNRFKPTKIKFRNKYEPKFIKEKKRVFVIELKDKIL